MIKQLIFILSLSLVASQSFAQGSIFKIKKGFYLNPNFNHTEYRYKLQNHQTGMQKNILFAPNLTLGYLWGNKNRHNISITSLGGSIDHSYQTLFGELRYSYDILAFRKNKFSFYISPYLRESFGYGRNDSKYTNNMYDFTQFHNTVSAGLAPVFEYKLGKRIDFVASLPLELAAYQYGKYSYYYNNEPSEKTYQGTNFINQGEVRIGIRLNLFRK